MAIVQVITTRNNGEVISFNRVLPNNWQETIKQSTKRFDFAYAILDDNTLLIKASGLRQVNEIVG